MADLVGTVDQGPISTRFMLFDHGGNEVGRHQFEAEQIPLRAGWVVHSPVEIWECTRSVIQTTMIRLGLAASDLAASGRHQPTRDDRCLEQEDRPPVP
jgi:glycerol kinase